MEPLVTSSVPVAPEAPLRPPADQKSLAPAILIFALTTLIFFGILVFVFKPKDTTKADKTEGRVSRSQCEQMVGKVVILSNGHSICQIEGASFSLTD